MRGPRSYGPVVFRAGGAPESTREVPLQGDHRFAAVNSFLPAFEEPVAARTGGRQRVPQRELVPRSSRREANHGGGASRLQRGPSASLTGLDDAEGVRRRKPRTHSTGGLVKGAGQIGSHACVPYAARRGNRWLHNQLGASPQRLCRHIGTL